MVRSSEWIVSAIVFVDSICESRLSTRVVQMQRRGRLSIGKKDGAIKRMDSERDSLCGFHLRIAAFDAGCANTAAGQDINREKGWWISIAVIIHSFDRRGISIAVIIHSFDPTRTIALVIHSVDPYI